MRRRKTPAATSNVKRCWSGVYANAITPRYATSARPWALPKRFSTHPRRWTRTAAQKERSKTMARSLVLSAATLSSGTLATITGQTQYRVLETIQADFVQFCMRQEPQLRWQDAWQVYAATPETVYASLGAARPARAGETHT